MTKSKYLKQLIKDCNKAQELLSKKNLVRIKIIKKGDSIDSILKHSNKGIYIIKDISCNKNQTFCKFNAYKTANHKTSKLPKENQPSNILYVGSSTTNLKGRLKQHTEKCPDKTYSLKLYEWFDNEYEIEVRIYKTASNQILQLIEDHFSFDLKPAFGRTGTNGK